MLRTRLGEEGGRDSYGSDSNSGENGGVAKKDLEEGWVASLIEEEEKEMSSEGEKEVRRTVLLAVNHPPEIQASSPLHPD